MFEENYGNEVVCALNRASRETLEGLGVLSPRGVMLVGLAHEEPQFDVDCAALGFAEVPLAEAHDRVPILSPDVVRAGIYEDALDIDTDRLLQSMAREIRASSGEVRTGAEVLGIARGDGWRI